MKSCRVADSSFKGLWCAGAIVVRGSRGEVGKRIRGWEGKASN